MVYLIERIDAQTWEEPKFRTLRDFFPNKPSVADEFQPAEV
ncbi:hypothetical protein [Amycolatopsis sp. NPDC059657]